MTSTIVYSQDDCEKELKRAKRNAVEQALIVEQKDLIILAKDSIIEVKNVTIKDAESEIGASRARESETANERDRFKKKSKNRAIFALSGWSLVLAIVALVIFL